MAGLRQGVWVAAAALLAACAVGETVTDRGIEVPPPPPTDMRDVVDTLHGVEIADPYRWLEDQDAAETRTWIDAQNAYTDSLLGGLPGRDALRARAAAVLERDAIGLPNERGGRYFFSLRRADQDLAVLYWRDGIDGADQVLIDPHPMSLDHTTTVELRDLSDDGTMAVYAVREGGVDEVAIHVRAVDTGEDLPDVLPPARYGSVLLAPDGSGLYYERYGDVTPRVMFHDFGSPLAEDVQLFGDGYERHHIPSTVISDDGRWMAVHVIEGSSGPTEIHIKDLANDTPFVTAIADGVSGILGRVRRRSVRHRHEPRCAEQAGGGGRSGEPGGRSVARGDPGTGRRRRGGGASAWREAGRVASAGCPAARRDPRDGRHACPGSRIRHGRIGRRRGRPLDERRSVLHLPDLPRPADHLSLRHGHRRAVRVGRAGNAGRPGRLRR